MLISLATTFFLLSLSPVVTCGDKILFTIPIWYPIEKIWSIFRCTGRFIWMPAYILILILMVGIWRLNKKHYFAFGFLIFLIGLQAIDITHWMKRDAIKKIDNSYIPIKEYSKLNTLVTDHSHICFSNIHENFFCDKYVDIIRSVIHHKSTMNVFYFARAFDGYYQYVATQADSAMRNPSEDCLYVLVDGMPEETSILHQTLDIQQIGHYVVGTKKETSIPIQNRP